MNRSMFLACWCAMGYLNTRVHGQWGHFFTSVGSRYENAMRTSTTYVTPHYVVLSVPSPESLLCSSHSYNIPFPQVKLAVICDAVQY